MRARTRMVRMLVCLALVALCAASVSVLLAAGASAQAPERDGAPDLAWIGPPGPWTVDRLAASPDGRTIVARRGILYGDREELVRSVNAGATWERIPFPEGYRDYPNRHMAHLRLVLGQHGGETVLLFSTGSREAHQLLRSTDLGTTWTPLFQVEMQPLDRPPELVLSPAFESDGVALLSAARRLYRSADAGRTWALVAEPADRLIRSVTFSPTFTADRRVLALLGPTEGYTTSPPATAPTVLASSDGAVTWSPLPVDPLPTDVTRPVVSGVWFEPPSSTATGGPPPLLALVGNQSTQQPEPGRLLRSTDAGASWTPVAEVKVRPGWGLAPLAFSPQYARDGVALLGESSGCQVLRTADRGASWTPITGTVPKCRDLRHLGHDGSGFVAGFEAESDATAFDSRWLRSRDGGQTWQPLVPGGAQPWIMAAVPAAGGALLGTRAGIWAIGGAASTVVPADARIPCQEQAVGAIGEMWAARPEVRRGLGCPLDPAQPAWIRELRHPASGAVSYWIDGADRSWYTLRRDGLWQSRSKREQPWPGRADAALAGLAQRFEGGVVLVAPAADATLDMVVLTDVGRQWWRFPGLAPEAATP